MLHICDNNMLNAYRYIPPFFPNNRRSLGGAWKTASGKQGTLDKQPPRLAPEEAGAWFEPNGWRISVPPSASILWHALPRNLYRKDGHATPEEGRIVLVLPFSAQARRCDVTVAVP